MQGALEIVVFVVVAVGALVAIVAVATNSSAYDQIGRGGLSLNEDGQRAPRAAAPSSPAEREEDIRQMVRARSERRIRQGRPALDVDAEVRALLRSGGAPDGELAEEIRQLVTARNARRLRQGKPALDVESEVARQLSDLRRGEET